MSKSKSKRNKAKKSKPATTLSRNGAAPVLDSVVPQTFAAPAPTAGRVTIDGVTNVSRRDLEAEAGFSGTQWTRVRDGGLPVEAYNPSLSGQAWFREMDEMRVVGAQFGSVEQVIKLPICATDWDVEGDSDELADLVRGNLLDDGDDSSMSDTWPDVLRCATNCVLYGLWAKEIVWKEAGGALVVRRLADRLPATIAEFLPAEDGGLSGIVQQGTDLNGDRRDVTIPIHKLLLLPWAKEGDNWYGRSMVRGAHQHWKIVQVAYLLANAGLSHNLNNVPYGTAPGNSTKEDRATLLAMLQAAQQGETSGFVLPAGYTVDALYKGATVDYILPYIQHHEAWMMRMALADFILLGESSRTFGSEKIHLFLEGLEAVTNHLQTLFNRHLVRRMVQANAPTATGGDMPRLVHTRVGLRMDLEAASDLLDKLTSGKWIAPSPDGTDENFWRPLFGLPEKDLSMLPAPPTGSLSRLQPASQEDQPSPDTAQPEQPAEAGTTSTSSDHAATQTYADYTVADVVNLRSAQAGQRDAWATQAEEHSRVVLQELLAAVDQAGASPDKLAALTVSDAAVAAWQADIAAWLASARVTAREAMGTAATPTDYRPTDTERARAKLITDHLVEAVTFEVATHALRGAGPEVIASRFAGVVDVRLRNDLDAEAQAIADQLNGATSG